MPELDTTEQLCEYEIIRTPQEWHQEHLEFVKNFVPKYTSLEDAEELEAAVYFDHAHERMVFCCTHCLEMLSWIPNMGSIEHVCKRCGGAQLGTQSCRAAYLALLGVRHPDCKLTDEEFQNKTQNLEPFAFVQTYIDFVKQEEHRRNIAERRALNLIKSLFGKRMYHQIVNNGETWVRGADNLHYRLFWGRHGNVAVYEHRYKSHARRAGKEWKPIAAYCGHFGEDYPISDQIIAQICMIKTNPNKYIHQANKVDEKDLSVCGPGFLYKEHMSKIMNINPNELITRHY